MLNISMYIAIYYNIYNILNIIWFGNVWNILFNHMLGIVIPTDFHIFQRGGSIAHQS